MTTKGGRIKSTTNSAPNANAKKSDVGITRPTEGDRSAQNFEPYHCKGRFLEDFEALCRQSQINYIVPVVLRPKPPTTPVVSSSISEPKEKTAPKTAKGSNNKDRDGNAHSSSHVESETIETSADDGPPRTYLLRDNQDYFKPKIQVEMENTEKQDTLTEILIRAWKIDRPTMDIFAQTLPTLERLHTLHFWHTGLTDDTLKYLSSILPKCSSLRTLILDNNPLPLERYDVLFTDENLPYTSLSLRHCRITEKGAALIAQGLGNERRQNKKILTLNLASNSIGDQGAEYIARSLKFNRTLLALNLSSNDISDSGVEHIAQVLSKFPLTADELAYRRQLLLQSAIDHSSYLQSARRTGGIDRRTSMNSSPTAATRKKSGVTTTAGPTRGKAAGATVGSKADGKETARAGKKDDKPAKKGATIADSKPSKAAGKPGADKPSRTVGNGKNTSALPGNRSAPTSEAEFLIADGIPILDQQAELIDDDLVLPGNKCLFSLNLSKNQITKTGVEYLLRAVEYQETFIKLNISTRYASSSSSTPMASQGLLRLELQRNDFVMSENEAHEKIQNLLAKRRESIFKSKDNADESTTGGRDTVGTARSRSGMRH